jgi:ABC-type phosphate/phosphonate transport system substrate-binding protein
MPDMAKAMLAHPILVGAVIHEPGVLAVWNGLKSYFAGRECPIDYVFYSNYKTQVDALIAGHIDIAWNSPLAWLDASRRTGGACEALAMRDTDRDRVSHVVVRKADGFTSLEDLRGKTLAAGAPDSPHGTLAPLHMLKRHGLVAGKDFAVRQSGQQTGAHGERLDGEREALQALRDGECHAAAVLDRHWDAWQAEAATASGSASTSNDPDSEGFVVLASTPPFDRANFTVLSRFPTRAAVQWTDALFGMSYETPAEREAMDLAEARAWLPGRTSGYAALAETVRETRFFEGDSGRAGGSGGAKSGAV